jgi:hypothetical protein
MRSVKIQSEKHNKDAVRALPRLELVAFTTESRDGPIKQKAPVQTGAFAIYGGPNITLPRLLWNSIFGFRQAMLLQVEAVKNQSILPVR